MKKPIDNTLIWFGWRADTGRPILERVEKNRCKDCSGFGTYGNPLCGAVYLCGRCKGTGHNPETTVQFYLHQLYQKIADLCQKTIDFLKKVNNMIWFIIYICGIVCFYLWDTFIGLGVEFDGQTEPPLIIPALFWFIAVPCLLMYNFVRFCNRVKEDRLKKQADERREQEKKRLIDRDRS